MGKRGEYTWGRFFKDYWMLLKGRRLRFTIFTILRSISNLAVFAIAFILGMIVDFFVAYEQGDSLNTFYIYVVSIAVLGTVQVWLRFFAKVRMQTIAANIRKEVRVKAMSKLMDLSLKWHEKEETGSKILKINRGGDSIFKGMKDFSNYGIIILMGIGGSMALFLGLNPKYFLFGLIFIAIYLTGEYYFNKRLIYWRMRLDQINERVSGKIHESASNLLTVKSLGLKGAFEKQTSKYEKQYYNTWVKTRDVSQIKMKTIKIFSSLGYAGFILLIGYDVISGLITVGSILVFATYFGKLQRGLYEVTHNMGDFIQAKSGVGRFMTIFGIETFAGEEGDNISGRWKKIEFQDVTFRYRNRSVLRDFNLIINRNDKIGIVGKTGCGKSTIVKLLLRLYKPQQGKILIDGKELSKYKQQSITDNIGVVLQESEMFNLSLLENITISTPKKYLARLKKSARIAQLDPLVRKLPYGFNTLIGEKGYQLSGGERQRVGLARALYKDTSLLILDEATSSLDSRTEELIQKGIERNLRGKTMLIIAHRLSTLKNVDRIIVMDRGKIVEEGSFGELLKKRGKFWQLYQLQGK